ncbi:flagellin [Methanoculleus receptaculi]|jgi:flagellin FlaB|uniref:Flagellin n=1 Tax=Methanoculleus receptaculi TaxID=394967 RepID=A0AAX4FUK0_9EURY|nr:flagellin [Methanoculleus receptaculi]WOX57123.1 flagellin [Methanoculleus receptaculi]
MSTSNYSEAGFTGLEAAIVLMAFVVVAATFAHAVLGTGLIFAGESRSVVHQSVRQAGSGLIAAGSVYGISSSAERIDTIIIPIGLTAGSEPIDINTVSIRLVGSAHMEEIYRNDPLIGVFPEYGHWSVRERINSDDNHLLEPGESYILCITPMNRQDCSPSRTFALEIKPAGSVALRVERTVPGCITPLTRLE